MAPAAFKGTLGPLAVATALAEGVRRVWPEADVRVRPLSDGGDGLLEAIGAALGGTAQTLKVTGPRGEAVDARILRTEGTAVIESAEACGLRHVPPGHRDPMRLTTRGVGELLAAAARSRPEEVVLGLGGSATVDGGTGMARALGWSFRDASGRAVPEGGGSLVDLARIERPDRAWAVPTVVLCDVDNPLTGPRGAARVYGPQKGASAEEVERLEAGLVRLAEVVRADLGVEVADLAGAGAAGGLGAGARAFLGGRLVSGAEWVMARVGLEAALAACDLVITGEGRYDAQSGMGKVTGRLLALAAARSVPALLVCGTIEDPPPAGVHGVDGAGRTLGPPELADLAASGCRALASDGRLSVL